MKYKKCFSPAVHYPALIPRMSKSGYSVTSIFYCQCTSLTLVDIQLACFRVFNGGDILTDEVPVECHGFRC